MEKVTVKIPFQFRLFKPRLRLGAASQGLDVAEFRGKICRNQVTGPGGLMMAAMIVATLFVCGWRRDVVSFAADRCSRDRSVEACVGWRLFACAMSAFVLAGRFLALAFSGAQIHLAVIPRQGFALFRS